MTNKDLAYLLVVGGTMYVMLSLFMYHVNHSHLSEMQVWLDFWKAITWDW